MLWALGGARFLGQLGTYLVPRLHHSASHCSDLFRLALQNTLFASFGKVSQGMPRYAKICQATRRLPKILKEFQKNVLGNTLMLPIAHLSWCSLHVKVWPWGSLFWICIPATLPGSQIIHLCQIICYLDLSCLVSH